MNKIITGSLLAMALLTFSAGSAFAGGSKKANPSVKLPYTFVCTHCHLKMTIKKAADWNKDCWVCACGAKAVDCRPKTK